MKRITRNTLAVGMFAIALCLPSPASSQQGEQSATSATLDKCPVGSTTPPPKGKIIRLLREASGGKTSATDVIVAPQEHWTTQCLVPLVPMQPPAENPICKHFEFFKANSRFTLTHKRGGQFEGILQRGFEPVQLSLTAEYHEPALPRWLVGTSPQHPHLVFYVMLNQRDPADAKSGFGKFYTLEVFNPLDEDCWMKHRPQAEHVCADLASQDCQPTELIRIQQGDAGGGYEPPTS